jgi:peroxiredoxin Q/BCP
MQRRQVLSGLSIAALGLLGLPRQALCLGGVLPEIDQPAPDFKLQGVVPGSDGEAEAAERSLSDFAGRWLVLYFYPRDFTEGCTIEARGFLLSDPGGSVSKAYGSWISPFSQRHTFLIDPQGVLRETWVAVRPSGHSQEVLTSLRQLAAIHPSA